MKNQKPSCPGQQAVPPAEARDPAPAGGQSQRRKTLAGLALLVLLGAVFRFYGIHETGPCFIDHGDYMLEARWLYESFLNLVDAVPQWIRESPDDLAEEFKRILSQTQGHPIIMGRPLHNLLIAIPMFLFGYDPGMGNVVSAFFGLLSIPLVYLLYRRLYGERGALMATAFFAFLGVHVHYSRSSFPEADSTFFLLLSLLFYVRSREELPEKNSLRYVCLSGIAWGLAITASDRWLGTLIVLWILEGHLWLCERKVSFRGACRRFVFLNLMVLAPLAAFELPYIVLRFAAGIAGKGMPFKSYLEILVQHSAIAQAMTAARFIKVLPVSGFRFSDLAFFPDFCIHYNGYLYTGLFAAGLFLLIRRRKFADILLLVCVLVPVFMLQLPVFHCMRHYSITFPLMAMICARALVMLGEGKEKNVAAGPSGPGRPGRFLILLFVVTLATGIAASWKAQRFPFGYDEAGRFLSEKGWKVLATNERIFQSYLGTGQCRPSPATEEELARDWNDGFQYLVVDFLPVIWDLLDEVGLEHERDEQRLIMVKQITHGNPPIAVFPNPGTAMRDNLFEALFNYRDASFTAARIREAEADTLRIYVIPETARRMSGERGIEEE